MPIWITSSLKLFPRRASASRSWIGSGGLPIARADAEAFSSGGTRFRAFSLCRTVVGHGLTEPCPSCSRAESGNACARPQFVRR
jgi:hypothetical protein